MTTPPLLSEDYKAVEMTCGCDLIDYDWQKEELKFFAAVDVNLEGSEVSAAQVSTKTGDQGVFMFVLMAALGVAAEAGNVYIKERK